MTTSIPDMSNQATTTESQSPKKSNQEMNGASDIDAPPVDALIEAGLQAEPVDDGPDAVEIGPEGTIIIDGKAFIDENAFYEMFIQAHVVGGLIFQLQTLLMAGEIEATRPASDELYKLILETDFLHFLIEPQNKYFKMIAVFGAYGLAIVPPILSEISAKRKSKQEAEEQPAAANDNSGEDQSEVA